MKDILILCGDSFIKSKNGDSPFKKIRQKFEGSHVCLNLETSMNHGSIVKKKVNLAQSENVFYCIEKEINILSLVNNHISDGGDPSKLVNILKSNGRIVIGPSNPSKTRTCLDGHIVEFISAYFTLPRYKISYDGPLADNIEIMLKGSTADHVVLNLHWGYEHLDVPAPFQRKLAHRFIDAGASLLIGHHPHVAQGYERYRGVDLYYSLGNFNFWQFDRQPSEENLWGYMVRYNLQNKTSFPIPIRINENYQPVPVKNQDQGLYSDRLQHLSKSLHEIDQASWFQTQYSHWYKAEKLVWREMLRRHVSLSLFIKYLAWLNMPMQWLYRYYAFFDKQLLKSSKS